jgi:hypothetical protein
MNSHHAATRILEAGLRWTARLLAAALVTLIVVIFVGQAGFNPMRFRAVEAVQMTFFLTECLGMVLAWRWPLLGGALATGALLHFFAVELAVTGHFPRGWVFPLMLVPGILFLVSGGLKALRRRQTGGGCYMAG